MFLSDEEESKESKENKECKEFKAEFLMHSTPELVLTSNISTFKISTFYLLKEYQVDYHLFLPPPEII